MSGNELRVFGERLCWREEGIAGDRSCPRLATVVHCRNCSEYPRIGRLLFEREAPAGLAAETAALLALPEEVLAGESISLMLFRLGQEYFALKTTLFQEVTAPHPVHRLPFRAGPVFLGLVNVNGELLPCVSAAAALGVEQEREPEQPRMVVIGRDGNRFAFVIDEALSISRVAVGALFPPPSTVSNTPSSKSSSLFHHEGREFALVDEDRFVEALSRSLHS